jgi:hypothetical protein
MFLFRQIIGGGVKLGLLTQTSPRRKNIYQKLFYSTRTIIYIYFKCFLNQLHVFILEKLTHLH